MSLFTRGFLPSVLMAMCGVTLAASPVAITNASFETLPSGGLNVPCGGTCAYSEGVAIPGWTDGGDTGQWITGGYGGNPSAINGTVLAYTNDGYISQDVGAALAGSTYTLVVALLHRADYPMAGVIQLEIGGTVVATATGADQGPGTWSDWTATYTASAADAGKTVTILLSATTNQGDFDNVRLNSSLTSTPEPTSFALAALAIPMLALLRKRLSRR
jgi:hypothetical protein